MACSENDVGEILCVNPANGFKFYYDPATEMLIRGSPNHDAQVKKTKTTSPQLVIS